MTGDVDLSKRQWVQAAGLTMVGGLVAAGSGLVVPANAEGAKPGACKIDEITPPEDLMREHGVLDRVLLVYEAGLRKFAVNEDFDNYVLLDCALAQATETFDFKDVLEPVVVGLVAPAPTIDLIKLCCRIRPLVTQRSQQDFGLACRQREFHQAYSHLHRQVAFFDKGPRRGRGRTRQSHDLLSQL